jgi:L-fuconolactonase
MPGFPIVDSHLHIWDVDRLRYPWLRNIPLLDRTYSLADYNAACAETRVAAMVFLQCEVDPSQFVDEAAWVTEQAALDPRIEAMVCWAPLELGDAARPHIERLKEFALLRSIRRIVKFEADHDYCLRPGFVAGVRSLADHGLGFDLCISADQLESATRLADLCPNVPMILDHLGTPHIRDGAFEPWRRQLADLARRPNVICKISGLATEADHARWTPRDLRPYLLAALESFGPDRLVFGGDWPVATQATSYSRWIAVVDKVFADLSADELRAIFAENARRTYRLAAT